MSDERERLDSVERLAKGSIDALGTLLEQHIVLARLMGALIAVLSADDVDLDARLARVIEAQGGELTETQRQFLANFLGGGDKAANLPDLEPGATAH
jgi:hypothetical protein